MVRYNMSLPYGVWQAKGNIITMENHNRHRTYLLCESADGIEKAKKTAENREKKEVLHSIDLIQEGKNGILV